MAKRIEEGDGMIDTDKYEGHTEGPWELSPDDWVWAEHLFMQDNTTNFGNAMLITDAPLLLAEVERLREQIESLRSLGLGRDGIEASGWDSLNAEVKRLRKENDELHTQRVQFSWIQESRTGRSSRYVGEEE